MQLMHNLGEHRHVQERQDWLQTKLKDVHTASLRNNAERGRTRRLLPEEFPELEKLTDEERQYIQKLSEMLLNPQ
ncbi:PTHY protein, partial [Polyodon spathula]|nr:PTHY protein [Polyodon spathula]